jgi:hypothetical protein
MNNPEGFAFSFALARCCCWYRSSPKQENRWVLWGVPLLFLPPPPRGPRSPPRQFHPRRFQGSRCQLSRKAKIHRKFNVPPGNSSCSSDLGRESLIYLRSTWHQVVMANCPDSRRSIQLVFRCKGLRVDPRSSFNTGVLSGLLNTVKGGGASVVKNEKRWILVSQASGGPK